MSSQFRLPLLVLLGSITSGCLNDARVTAPPADRPAASAVARSVAFDAGSDGTDQGFFPLTPGNRWRLRVHDDTRLFEDGKPPVTVLDIVWTNDLELICDELAAGTRYVYQLNTVRLPNGGNSGTYRFRQDRDGLWRSSGAMLPPETCGQALSTGIREASARSARDIARQQMETALRDHPQRTAIIAAVTELQRQPEPTSPTELRELAYPLHVGKTWLDGLVKYTVEAHEILRTPAGDFPAWRIRQEYPYTRPVSRALLWYGKAGYLQEVSHAEYESVRNGMTIVIKNDHTEYLEFIDLAEPGGSATVLR